MIHSSQALQERFDKKKEGILEMNLEFNGDSRCLFEELLRKNNEIIKLCINSFTEATERLDQFDATFQRLKQELCRVGDTQANFHFEFRRTHLEMQKKQTQLNNEVSMLKNALKIQMKEASAEAYLNSDFFKQKASRVMPRGKGRDFCHKKTKTNFSVAHLRFNLNEGEAAPELQSKSVKNENEEPLSAQISQLQETFTKKMPILRHAYTMIEQGFGETFQTYQTLQNEQIRTKINKLELKIQQCFRQIQNNKHNKQHLYVQEVYKKINQKISEQLESKVQINYLQSSLQNLKQAWQNEENQLYVQLQSKVDKNIFRQLVQRVSILAESIEKFKKYYEIQEKEVRFNKSNLNRSNIYLRNMLLSRPSSKQNLALSQIMIGDSLIRNQEQRTSIKNSLNFANSLSAVKIGRNQRKHINVDSVRQFKEKGNISQKAWKQRVSDLLEESKTIKQAKNYKK